MPKPKNDKRIIMYVSYPLKMKIGAYMSRNSIKTFSEFLRMATFFLMNDNLRSTKDIERVRNRTVKTKAMILTDPINKVKLEVMEELKQLFKKGGKLLKKIE